MKQKMDLVSFTRAALILSLFLAATCSAILAQTPAFTYQGRFTDAALPASGTYQMQFTIFDAASGGTQIGLPVINNAVTVANGVFTVSLDFTPATPFANGADRWIEVAVKKPAEGSLTTLAPRQKLTSAPYATKSLRSADSDNLGGLAANTFLQTNGNGSALTNLNGANIAAGSITGSQLNANARSKFDTSLVALQRWDLLPNFKTIPVGSSPQALGFDGTFVYTANTVSNNVTRIRASTGAVEGTPIAVGTQPSALAFDGTFVYVTNRVSNTMTRIRASTGVVDGTVIGFLSPEALAFDGTFVYVANDAFSGTVTRIRASTGQTEGGTIAVGSFPEALVFDGTFIYSANSNSDNVTRIRASTGLADGTISVGDAPRALAFDGTFVYVANSGSNNLTRIRASTGAVEGAAIAVATFPTGLVFDGTFIYAASDASAGTLTRIRASTGLVDGDAIPVGNSPSSFVFDGLNIYVANRNSNTVTRFVP